MTSTERMVEKTTTFTLSRRTTELVSPRSRRADLPLLQPRLHTRARSTCGRWHQHSEKENRIQREKKKTFQPDLTARGVSAEAQRDAVIEDRERKYDRARLLNLQKEEMRWQNVLEEHLKAEARDQHLADGSKGSANHTSVAYDTISLEYFPTQQGQKQKYLDDLIKYKAGVRAETLQRRGAGQGYNPITGEEIKPISIPSKPRDPGAFHLSASGAGKGDE